MGAFNAVLKKTEKVIIPKKSASKVRELPVGKTTKKAVDEYVNLKKHIKTLNAEMDYHAVEIADVVGKAQDKDGFSGDFTNSYRVSGNNENVTVVNPNRFSVNVADEKDIKKLIGKKNFEACFEEEYAMSFKNKIFKDESLQEELVEFVGEDKFQEFIEKFVDTTKKLKVKKGFNEKVYSVIKKEKLADLRIFVKPAKLAIK